MEKKIIPVVIMIVFMIFLKEPLVDSNFESSLMRIIATGLLAGLGYFVGELVQRFVFRLK